MGKPVWTLKQMEELLEICIDLQKWYRGEKTKFHWKTNCKLCQTKFIKCQILKEGGIIECPNCPWVVFKGKRCAEFNRDNFFPFGDVGSLRSERLNTKWNSLRDKQLTRWIRLLRKRISYQRRKGK